MPTSSVGAQKVSKSTLSMFLRTRCDKELYLSMQDSASMSSAGMPAPVKRPGIGALSHEGRAFELQRNDQLLRLFASSIFFEKGPKGYLDIDLSVVLSRVTATPSLVLQGKFSIASNKDLTLRNIGLSASDIAVIPTIADFIPDVLVIRDSREGDCSVNPDGSRTAISELSENRLALDIFDVKHTSEANPSYCSEIAMYAVMMANWLDQNPALKARFFVSTDAYLWTRFKQGDSKLDGLERIGGSSPDELLQALVADSESANLRFYLAAIHRFFEDVARVIRVADAAPGAWRNLEWHVAGSCGSCDWLGDKRHLSKTDKDVVDLIPQDYCVPAAKLTGHLCLVPGITRGAKKILQTNLVLNTATLATSIDHAAFQQHTVLKREAKNLPRRSQAILTDTLANDTSAVIASLVKSANLLLYASVNFDSSAGLLTGLALSGVATSFTRGQAPHRFTAVPYVVDQKQLSDEWVALQGFLGQIADCIRITEGLVAGSSVTGQIHFWEERQFKELCNAIGRHLPKVLALTDKKAKALSWIFPPDEQLARPESIEAATIVTLEDIVRRMVFTPTAHVVTLFDTAENYASGPVQTIRDSYYREYLNNGIPRERIYEIWSLQPMVTRGSTRLPRNTVISEFSEALKKQSRALESIAERLRTDYAGHFKAKATHIPTQGILGTRGVAFDAKLWIWWDSLDFNTSQMEAHIRSAVDGERLEASYEAIILTNGVQVSPGVIEYDVGPGSTEAKFKEDTGMLAMGKMGQPGLPLARLRNLIAPGAPAFPGKGDFLMQPFWSAIDIKLLAFDRVNAKAKLRLSNFRDPLLAPYFLANSNINLMTDVFVLDAKRPNSMNWAGPVTEILREIGNPAIATPDVNAAAAMGITNTGRGGNDPITPAACVLWDAANLQSSFVTTAATAANIAAYAATIRELNSSQKCAVAYAAEHALTIVWGPPGTGKTSTLAALLHALSQHACVNSRPLKVLVTGPTYKAVEELMRKTAESLAKDLTAPASMYFGYSKGRSFGPTPDGLPTHVIYTPVAFDSSDPDFQQCLTSLSNTTEVVIVGCQVQQARRFSKLINNTMLHPIFDVVVIDESSQVPVSKALAAMTGLKANARLIVAGDHLQMPPITSLDAPADAAYLVGSIQTYLLRRDFGAPLHKCILETNYRSAEDIVGFARRIGYPGSLNAGYENTALHHVNPLPARVTLPAGLVWCDAFAEMLSPAHSVLALLHDDEVSSQGNHFEAKVVASAVWMLRKSVSAELEGRHPVTHRAPTADEFWNLCVGIVTPHRAQRALVIRELSVIFPAEKDLIDEAVDTVERFQGGERHTIIVTYGVADTDVISGEEAFLMQLERTNVAVSRAMAKSIVIMPRTLAAYIPEDKKTLATAFALKDYIEEYCNVRVDTTLSDTLQTRAAQLRYH